MALDHPASDIEATEWSSPPASHRRSVGSRHAPIPRRPRRRPSPIGTHQPARRMPWKTGSRRTPPMGWNTWNTFECTINETLVKQTTDLMVSSGMRDRGYTYVNLDDCWMTRTRDSAGNLVADSGQVPQRPQGPRRLHPRARDEVRHLRERRHRDLPALPRQPRPRAGRREHFASWGVDYLKYDNCGSPVARRQQDYVRRYSAMRDALKATGRPIAYSLCEWGNFSPSTWAAERRQPVAHHRRHHNNWGSIDSIYRQNVGLASAAKPGAWNDPDMLEVGDGMDFQEDRAHFTLWAAMAAPLIAGADLRSASVATFSTYLNSRRHRRRPGRRSASRRRGSRRAAGWTSWPNPSRAVTSPLCCSTKTPPRKPFRRRLPRPGCPARRTTG